MSQLGCGSAALLARQECLSCITDLLRIAKSSDKIPCSAGVSPAVPWASCPRVYWGGTPQRQRPGRPRYFEVCYFILQCSLRGGRPNALPLCAERHRVLLVAVGAELPGRGT